MQAASKYQSIVISEAMSQANRILVIKAANNWRLLIALFVLPLLLISCKGENTIRVHLTEIIDIATGQPVEADVYVNDNLVSRGVTEATFDVLVPGKIEVKFKILSTIYFLVL
jgi:hypothetical protein